MNADTRENASCILYGPRSFIGVFFSIMFCLRIRLCHFMSGINKMQSTIYRSAVTNKIIFAINIFESKSSTGPVAADIYTDKARHSVSIIAQAYNFENLSPR